MMTNDNYELVTTDYKLRVLLRKCEKVFGSDIPVSFLNIFLTLKPGQRTSVSDIRKLTTLSPAGVSRAIAIMGAYVTPDRKGRTLDKPLLQLSTDIQDRRYKYVELTKHGIKVLAQVSSIEVVPKEKSSLVHLN